MAVVRARSSPPYALIVFVFLTVISAGLAIYFCVGKNDAEKRMADAEDKLKETRNSQDTPFADKLSRARSSKSESLLAEAASEIKALEDTIESSEGRTPTEVVFDAKAALEKVGKPNSNLTFALGQSNDLVNQYDAQNKQLAQQLKDQQVKAEQTAASNKSDNDSSQVTRAQLMDQVTVAQAALAAAQKDKEDYATSVQKELADARTAHEDDKRIWVLKQQDFISKIASLEGQIDTLKQLIKTQAAPTVALAPAGHILRKRAASDECYIDLGAKDRVVVGLTFSVHDSRLGIGGKIDDPSAKEDLAAAGKGGIEVLEVGPTESLCRITETAKGQMISAGDLISNPVYQNSKNRKYHFVVIGDFDLDGDGVATAAERDRVAHLIAAWGGVIDDTVTPQTDYLVAGTEPPAGSATDDQSGSATVERGKVRQSYEEAIAAAKASTVPILNANRFLAMVGYYSTTVVR